MSSLKTKIKTLEKKVMADKVQFANQKWLLHQRLQQIFTTYLGLELIVSSFVLGFILGYRNFALFARQLLARGLALLNGVRLANRYLNFLQ